MCSASLTFLQMTSVPALPRLLSGRRRMEVWLSSCPHVPWASVNDGQPVPESYLASELLGGGGEGGEDSFHPPSMLITRTLKHAVGTPEEGGVTAHTVVHPHFGVV